MNYLPSKVPLNKPSWQRHSNAKSLHVSRALFIHLSDCIFRMLLFLPIIFSIMYKVLLEAFNRGPTQWHERHSIHFLFERHGHHDYPMLLPTNKRIHLRTNRMFYFSFSSFLFIAAFRLPPSELRNLTISENPAWILNTRKCCSYGHFHGSRDMWEERPAETLRDRFGLFLRLPSLEIVNICGDKQRCRMCLAVYYVSNFISSHGSPSGHLTAWGQAC